MRASLVAISLMIATAALSAEGSARVIVKRARPGGMFAELLIEVRNDGPKTLQTVRMSCAVFDKSGEVLGADDGYVENIDPGASAYVKKLIDVPNDQLSRVDNAICRVISAR